MPWPLLGFKWTSVPSFQDSGPNARQKITNALTVERYDLTSRTFPLGPRVERAVAMDAEAALDREGALNVSLMDVAISHFSRLCEENNGEYKSNKNFQEWVKMQISRA